MRMCIHPDCGWVPVLTGPFSYSPNVFGAQVFAREHALCAWWRDEVPVSFKTAVDISRAPILASKLCQGIQYVYVPSLVDWTRNVIDVYHAYPH